MAPRGDCYRRESETTTCAGKGKGLGSADSSFRGKEARETVEQENAGRELQSLYESSRESAAAVAVKHERGPDPSSIPLCICRRMLAVVVSAAPRTRADPVAASAAAAAVAAAAVAAAAAAA